MDNKRLEIIEWCQKKEEAENGAMMDMEEFWQEERSIERLPYLTLHSRMLRGGTLRLEGLLNLTLSLRKARHFMLGPKENCYPTLDLRELLLLMGSIEKAWSWVIGLEEFLHPMLDSEELLQLTWVGEEYLCMMMSMEGLGHPTFGLEGIGYPMIGLRECWLPTLDLGRFAYSTLGWRASRHPTLEDGEVFGFTLVVGRVWDPTWSLGRVWPQIGSKGSTYLYLPMIYLRFLQVHLPRDFHTLPCFLRIATRQLMRSDSGNISEFLHALLMHEDTTPAFRTGPSSWQGYIEVAFHLGRLQSTRLKDYWKTML